MLPEFLTYLEAERRYSPLTVRNYRHDVEQFLAWLGVDDARFEPQRITTDDIREWILYRTETGRVSAASMNREISSLRALFRWLLRTGAVGRDVVHPIPSLRTSQRLPAFVPESRMNGIVSECECDSEDFVRERNSLIILLLYTCGLRLAELVGIDRDDFSADFSSLRIRGKGDKERIVPMLEFVREKILHYIGILRLDDERVAVILLQAFDRRLDGRIADRQAHLLGRGRGGLEQEAQKCGKRDQTFDGR